MSLTLKNENYNLKSVKKWSCTVGYCRPWCNWEVSQNNAKYDL